MSAMESKCFSPVSCWPTSADTDREGDTNATYEVQGGFGWLEADIEPETNAKKFTETGSETLKEFPRSMEGLT